MEATIIPVAEASAPPAEPIASLLEDVELQWRRCEHVGRDYLNAVNPDPKSAFIVTFALDGQPEKMADAVTTRLAEGRRYGLDALSDVRQQFLEHELYRKLRRLTDSLTGEREAVAKHQAEASEALATARQALAIAQDPVPHEKKARAAQGEVVIHANRAEALEGLVADAAREAESELHVLLLAKQKQIREEAVKEANEIRAEIAGLYATRLERLLFLDGIDAALARPGAGDFFLNRQLPLGVDESLPAAA
jgi:hypothetical protein